MEKREKNKAKLLQGNITRREKGKKRNGKNKNGKNVKEEKNAIG